MSREGGGGAHAAAMVLGQREDRETFGRILLQPCGEFRGGIAVICNQFGQGGFGLGQRTGGPDFTQLGADALSDRDVRRVMDGVPGEVEWTPVPTPDALDMLITSRNHDLKSAIVTKATPEDWLFALVSLQTQRTFDVQYHGITRAKSGAASRAFMSLAPASSILPHAGRACEFVIVIFRVEWQYPKIGVGYRAGVSRGACLRFFHWSE